MTKIDTATLSKGALLAALAFGLSACTDADVARILAEGGEDFPTDFDGQTFPVYFATGENEGDSGRTDAGIGSARFISTTQIEADIPGQPRRIYTRVGMTNEWDPGDGGFSLFIDDLGSVILANNVDVDGLSGGVAAYAGFETAVEDRPMAARYKDGSFGAIFLSDDTQSGIASLDCTDCVDLQADFVGGTISGQVFNGTATIDGGDTLTVVNTLSNGTISSSGYTGDIDVELTLMDGGGSMSVDATTGNQNVIGRFFGDNAQSTAVVYETDFSIEAGEDSFSGTMAGASDAFAD